MKSITLTLRKGALPADTSWWTEQDWEEHRAYVKELEAKGELLAPFDRTFNLVEVPEFDGLSKKPLFSNFELVIPKGRLKDGGETPFMQYCRTKRW